MPTLLGQRLLLARMYSDDELPVRPWSRIAQRVASPSWPVPVQIDEIAVLQCDTLSMTLEPRRGSKKRAIQRLQMPAG
ncbi:hypothetical protein DK37_28200 [Halomonas sp. SUBG004]|nr:hypothetical protein DK37_28200 [Halomonas sp. SUBG004]